MITEKDYGKVAGIILVICDALRRCDAMRRSKRKYFQEASPERTLVFSVLPRATVLPKKDIIIELFLLILSIYMR